MAGSVAPGLEALLAGIIDYAGMFPPATLPPDAAIARYQNYCRGSYSWMLRWLVVGAAELPGVPRELDGSLAVLSDRDEARAAVVESKQIIRTKRPTYCEVPLADLDAVARAGCFAKIRTGGVKAEAIPAVEEVAAFIRACAERRLPFKATAGLHHPVRGQHPLTLDRGASRAVMHGFLNVFLAAAFAWHGQPQIEPILAETDAAVFRFDDRIQWRDWSLDTGQVREARTGFAHAFGSCSFEEPIHDLEALGLL
jgi:hypothetical protein